METKIYLGSSFNNKPYLKEIYPEINPDAIHGHQAFDIIKNSDLILHPRRFPTDETGYNVESYIVVTESPSFEIRFVDWKEERTVVPGRLARIVKILEEHTGKTGLTIIQI